MEQCKNSEPEQERLAFSNLYHLLIMLPWTSEFQDSHLAKIQAKMPKSILLRVIGSSEAIYSWPKSSCSFFHKMALVVLSCRELHSKQFC